MARDGTGSFNRLYNWVNDRDSSVPITATRIDAEQDGIAAALSESIARDGQTTITANLPMATYKHTGVGASNARTNYADTASVQDGSFNYVVDTGAADAYVMTLSPAITAYATGAHYVFKAVNASTGASTLNISSIGVKTILKHNDQAIEAGDIEAGSICVCIYDGTSMQLVSSSAVAPIKASDTLTFSGNNTHSGTNQFNKTVYLKKGADITSANDLVLPTDGNSNDITGSVAINGMTDGVANETRHFKADSALPLKHNTAASSGFSSLYIVQGAADVTLDVGAEFDVIYDGTLWRVFNINLASGQPVVASTQKIAQIVSTQTGAVATGTTIMPHDDTIPQITQGDEYMTLAITPTSATNKLQIDVVIGSITSNATGFLAQALFVGTTANALATTAWHASANINNVVPLTHTMTAGSTSTLTFRVRAGNTNTGTTTFNGESSARKYGGSLASSITITEYTP